MASFLIRGEWYLYKFLKRKRLRNRTPSIISDNCNAGIIYHDLGLPFLSPTINLFFLPDDYLRFLKNLRHYLSLEPVETTDSSVRWPVGLLDDVKVHFMHYKSFQEAKAKWFARISRVDFNNLYVLMSEKNGCTCAQMTEFDSMPFQHKALLTHLPYPELKSSNYIRGFEGKSELGVVTDFRPGILRRRYLDAFDYVSFLNSAQSVDPPAQSGARV